MMFKNCKVVKTIKVWMKLVTKLIWIHNLLSGYLIQYRSVAFRKSGPLLIEKQPTFFTTAGEPPFIPEEGETQADNSNE